MHIMYLIAQTQTLLMVIWGKWREGDIKLPSGWMVALFRYAIKGFQVLSKNLLELLRKNQIFSSLM